MPIFTAASAYIAATIGVESAMGIAAINFGVRVLASYVITSLLSKRDAGTGAGTSTTQGNRVQFPPATDNKLPVVYGSAFISPCITDAVISTDQTTMWYVMALCETTDTGTISFDRQWWGDKELFFDTSDHTKVVKWIDSSDVENTNVSGNMYVYYFNNGSSSGTNTSQTAIQVMQNTAIDTPYRWTSNHLMSNTAFAIVKLIYNQDAGTTGLEQFKVQVTNTLNQPGSVINDYLTNTRYGCAIPSANVDSAAISALNAYSAEMIPYTAVGGGTNSQARYTINGPINTNNTCLTNLQQMVDSCDCWLKWDEVNGKWSVVINQSYTDYTTYDDLFVIDSSSIVGGVDVNPVDLNSTYNSVEGQFPNNKIKDQTDYTYTILPSSDRSPNEPDNRLTVQYPLINTSVQATYINTRRLIQSREDLIVNFSMDYSGIQIEAGDVVRVRHPVYGWGPIDSNPSNPDKLFRVNQVIEQKGNDGSLGVKLSLIEYNDQVYQNITIQDYTPSTNTGISNPGWISTPGAPVVTDGSTATSTTQPGEMTHFKVTATVPTTGTVLYMDFYYGTTNVVSSHKLYRTVTPNSGRAFTNGSTVTIQVNDLPAGTYYWSVKARNATSPAAASGGGASQSSPSTASPLVWLGAALILPAIIGGVTKGGLLPSIFQNPVAAGSGYKKSVQFSPAAWLLPDGTADNGVPVNVTTTSDRNRPLIFTGSDPGTSNIWPWGQGTTPGMTGPYVPLEALSIGISEGDDGWYKAIYWDTSVDKIDTGEMGMVNMNLYLMTDTENTIIQICNYLIFEGDPTTILLQENIFSSHLLALADPHPVTISITDVGTGEAAVIEWGYMIRNITSGSNVQLWGAFGILQQLTLNEQWRP